MGKFRRKRHNWKARNISEVEIDNSATKKIKIDIEHRKDKYDSCNALVLPNKKRKTKTKVKQTTTTHILSKKKRKELEKVVQRKQKKLNRAELLEELAKVQVPEEELKRYVSLATVQTKGRKCNFSEVELPAEEYKPKRKFVFNSIKGSNKKKRLALLQDETKKKAPSDPNVLGFTESSSSESEPEIEENKDELIESKGETERNNNYEKEPGQILTEKNDCADNNSNVKDTEESLITTVAKEKNDSIDNNSNVNNIEKSSITAVVKERKPAVFVMLQRKPEIQAARLKLPIIDNEQIIVEAINDNPVVIITGATGSGKTTQIPQFLYEAGYAKEKMIGITEPRRVAAISMSKRVAEEMNLTEKEVSYLIRFEGNTTPETKIKFMTDGVLLKEIQNDLLLRKYSVIILDEAHERSIDTDILIGLLSRIVPVRYKKNIPLKLIIMSATLRVEDFAENSKLFKVKPPVINVDTRQFPVQVMYNRTTKENYVSEALKKAVKVHTRLPEGGILIFLTGQQEVNFVVNKLRNAFPMKDKKRKVLQKKGNSLKKEETTEDKSNNDNNDSNDEDFRCKEAIRYNKRRRKMQIQLPEICLDDYSVIGNPREDSTGVDDDAGEVLDENEYEDDDMIDLMACGNSQPLWVLPLYANLPTHVQEKVFEPPPEEYRLCVVSTNIAETSLTIPGIKYVIDCGRCKTRIYDKVTGVSTYRISYISKASAHQRAGRAGRVGPGFCYRLYSSAVFDQFEQYSQPEILTKPIDDLILRMKVMRINNVLNFSFPTPPEDIQIKNAEERLIVLGALEKSFTDNKNPYCAKVTQLGRSISAYPVGARYGKMLALSCQHNLFEYTVLMVAALSVQEVLRPAFRTDSGERQKWYQMRRFWAGNGNSLLLGDPMVLLKAVGNAEYAVVKGQSLESFCNEFGLNHKAVVEVRKIRQQLTNEINLNIKDANISVNPEMKPPDDTIANLLRQIMMAGMGDRVAKKVMPDEVYENQEKRKFKYAYKTPEMVDPVFMHSTCVLSKTLPDWVVYQEIFEATNGKMYMRGVTAIEPAWLPIFVPSLCNLGDPVTDPPPRYDNETGKVMCRRNGTFGKAGWQLPSTLEMEYPLSMDGIKWFASFFLEGKICPKLEQFVPHLLSSARSVIKPYAKLIPRTNAITQPLLYHKIITKKKLLDIWKTDRTFLLSSYQKWLPTDLHNHVAVIWPPI